MDLSKLSYLYFSPFTKTEQDEVSPRFWFLLLKILNLGLNPLGPQIPYTWTWRPKWTRFVSIGQTGLKFWLQSKRVFLYRSLKLNIATRLKEKLFVKRRHAMGGVLCEASTTICVTFSWPFSHQHSLVSVLDSLLCKMAKHQMWSPGQLFLWW